jgi:hypothetical protein
MARIKNENYDKEAYIAMKKEEENTAKELLTSGFNELLDSDNYRNYLKMVSTFHRYSVSNNFLILSQGRLLGIYPTHVASKTTWKKLGREINENATKFLIYGYPVPWKKDYEVQKKDRNGNLVLDDNGLPIKETKTVRGYNYPIEYVYDVSQTNGKELPEIASKLTGTLEENNKILLEAIKSATTAEIVEGNTRGANGYYSLQNHQIVISPDLDEVMKLKTTIHEVAHSILHCDKEHAVNEKLIDNKSDTSAKELEAESTAFIVMNHFNIPSDEYSFGYLVGWADGNIEKLKNILPYVQKAADTIINSMEQYIVLEKENYIENEEVR